ncbi:MAG TPA: thioredoxin domain-containing protein, partial [Planctomycetaceae bacterium]|nr:thioredoxin domain-containing protein [Planctomycetaceae bacterium]
MSDPVTTANRLLHETSPYLQQHAYNPVDWHPWGTEALAKARELDRPIFLSIGYSACHWCHVMEHESFENEAIARLMNERFINIKVDREERPDLDQIYMNAVQLMTRRGGWPMSVFLTPALKPFFGGTYWPPESRMGMPGFREILVKVSEAWQARRSDVERGADELTDAVRQIAAHVGDASELDETLLRRAMQRLLSLTDRRHGGFGGAPKFPHAMDLRLLLRCWQRFGDGDALDAARLTLDKMAAGGIYDHLGGGFHRYSTDERWLVPHFEKMLYDNALLVPAYLEAHQATGDPDYARVARETLDYVLCEMTQPQGGFYSTQDADSEGVEGKYFVWSEAEVEQILGPDDARVFNDAYDVTRDGNWEGQNILNRSGSDPQSHQDRGTGDEELAQVLARCRRKLFEVRSRRIAPGRDDKVLVSW